MLRRHAATDTWGRENAGEAEHEIPKRTATRSRSFCFRGGRAVRTGCLLARVAARELVALDGARDLRSPVGPERRTTSWSGLPTPLRGLARAGDGPWFDASLPTGSPPRAQVSTADARYLIDTKLRPARMPSVAGRLLSLAEGASSQPRRTRPCRSRVLRDHDHYADPPPEHEVGKASTSFVSGGRAHSLGGV